MASRREFLQQGLSLTTLGLAATPLIGCATPTAAPKIAGKGGRGAPTQLAQAEAPAGGLEPPPDLFDAQLVDIDFWVKPRTLTLLRPASGERASVLYWKDGEMIDSAYQELCHLLRDVNGKATAPIDPKLLETLWGTQAFVARYGLEHPLEILSGYRTPASNKRLIEAGVPAARQSLHISGKAADIRIANLNEEVLGGLVKSFRQGGVGFYYRSGPKGGWIHADTGLNRTWKG
ncbi:MAG: YcbK family protein [Massilia sp.]